METIKFSEWQKLDLRVGKILKAEDIEGADKLYKLEIDLGNEKRTLVAGLKPYYKKEELREKPCIVFTNLEPRTIRGIESKGMILAAVSEDMKKVHILQPDAEIEEGSRIS
jgi:methionyl-tRNA synthetase